MVTAACAAQGRQKQSNPAASGRKNKNLLVAPLRQGRLSIAVINNLADESNLGFAGNISAPWNQGKGEG
jgi:hypothetical protein